MNKNIFISFQCSIAVWKKAKRSERTGRVGWEALWEYSLNLNPIERLWKYANEQERNNVYCLDAKTFREILRHFFHVTLPT